jgi:hypothetical protein
MEKIQQPRRSHLTAALPVPMAYFGIEQTAEMLSFPTSPRPQKKTALSIKS